MIKKLEEWIPIIGKDGEDIIITGQRPPDNKEIVNKINEIIEYINKKESIHYLF